MKHLIRHFSLFRCVVCGTVALLNLFHPLIHGTPLDGGLLDSFMMQLDLLAASLANTRETP
jgi:hypothetical protein